MRFFCGAILAALAVASATDAASPDDESCAATRQDGAQGVGMLQAQRKLLQDTETSGGPPCSCDLRTQGWKVPDRTIPKCVFIDLGANEGNTFDDFLKNNLNNVKSCANGGGSYIAHLVEANPMFNKDLKALVAKYPGVHSYHSTAAYMCEDTVSFHLDIAHSNKTVHPMAGSSMASNKKSIQEGMKKVSVPTLNVMKMIYEETIPEDNVILKMDIEGAEWDILPCLAQFENASKIDTFLVEIHDRSWGKIGTGNAAMKKSLAALKKMGVTIPDYHSIG